MIFGDPSILDRMEKFCRRYHLSSSAVHQRARPCAFFTFKGDRWSRDIDFKAVLSSRRRHNVCLLSPLSRLTMPAKQASSQRAWSMYPECHDQVAGLLEDDDLVFDFHGNDEPRSSMKEYDTTIMGRFRCENPSCASNRWSSKTSTHMVAEAPDFQTEFPMLILDHFSQSGWPARMYCRRSIPIYE